MVFRRSYLSLRASLVGFLAFGLLALSAYSQVQGRGIPHSAPPERLYPLIFDHIMYLEGLDAERTLSVDAPDSVIRTFFSGSIGMRPNENSLLLQEAHLWKNEAEPIDAQARKMVDSIHAKTPGGRLKPGELLHLRRLSC